MFLGVEIWMTVFSSSIHSIYILSRLHQHLLFGRLDIRKLKGFRVITRVQFFNSVYKSKSAEKVNVIIFV